MIIGRKKRLSWQYNGLSRSEVVSDVEQMKCKLASFQYKSMIEKKKSELINSKVKS